MATAYGAHGPLAQYNSLQDQHLNHYFVNRRVQRHLLRSGLITRDGCIVSDDIYRLQLARQDREKASRELLSKMIMDRTLDMERTRRYEIRRRMQEISKLEIVRRVKSGIWTGSGQQRPIVGPRPRRPHSAPRGRPSTPAAPGRERSRHYSSNSDNSTEDSSSQRGGAAAAAVPALSAPFRPVGTPGPRNRRLRRARTSSGASTDDVDSIQSLETNQLHQVLSNSDLTTFNDPRMSSAVIPIESPYHNAFPKDIFFNPPVDESINQWFSRSGTSHPTPPPHPYSISARGAAAAARIRRKHQRAKSSGDRLSRAPLPDPDLFTSQLKLRRTEIHSLVDVTFKYLGLSLKLEGPARFQAPDIEVIQQHCGGNTLCLFRGRVNAGEKFLITSRRHKGMPFALTFHINGVQSCRVSTCCEFKHSPGKKISRHFSVVSIVNGEPCDACRAAAMQPARPSPEDMPSKETGPVQLEPLPHLPHFPPMVSGESDGSGGVRTIGLAANGDDGPLQSRGGDAARPERGDDIPSTGKPGAVGYDADGQTDSNDIEQAASRAGGSQQRRRKSSDRPTRPISRKAASSSSGSSSPGDASTSGTDTSKGGDFASDSKRMSSSSSGSSSSSNSGSSAGKSGGDRKHSGSEQGSGSANSKHDTESAGQKPADYSDASTASSGSDKKQASDPDKAIGSSTNSPPPVKSPAVASETEQSQAKTSGEKAEQLVDMDSDGERKSGDGPGSNAEHRVLPTGEESVENPVPDMEKPGSADPEPKVGDEEAGLQSPSASTEDAKGESPLPSDKSGPAAVPDEEGHGDGVSAGAPDRQATASGEEGKRSPGRDSGAETKDKDSRQNANGESPAAIAQGGEGDEVGASKPSVQHTEIDEKSASGTDDKPDSALDDDGARSTPATATADDQAKQPSSEEVTDNVQDPAASKASGSASPTPPTQEQAPLPLTEDPSAPKSAEAGEEEAAEATPTEPTSTSTDAGRPPLTTTVNEEAGVAAGDVPGTGAETSPSAQVSVAGDKDEDANSTSTSPESHTGDDGKEAAAATTGEREEVQRTRQLSLSSIAAYGALGDVAGAGGDGAFVEEDSSREPEVEEESKVRRRKLARANSAHLDDYTVGARPTRLHTSTSLLPMIKESDNVELTNVDLTEEQLQEVCEKIDGSEKMKSLVLRNTSLSNENLAQLKPSLVKAAADLKMVNLNLNKVDASGVQFVSEVVRAAPNLRMLLMHGNPIGDEGAVALVNALLGKRQEVEADLPASSQATEGDDDPKPEPQDDTSKAVEFDGKPAPVEILDLGDCNLTDKSAPALCQLLAKTETLNELNLSGNCFSATGLVDIGEALGKNTSLTSLSLDYCGLGNEGIKALAVGLATNSSLTSIDVESTGLTDEAVEYLLEVLVHNKSLETINLSRNAISAACWHQVKQKLGERTRRRSN